MASPEHISHVEGDSDGWVCLCGNTPAADGFYPCDAEGHKVEPTATDWTTDCYVCDRCGRIIKWGSLEVVGRKAGSAVSDQPSR